MSTDRCLLFKVSISVSHGFLLAQFQTITLRCRSMMHLSKRVAGKSNGTSLLRMSTSANTVSFPNLMGTTLTSLVLATPPTPFAHTGIDYFCCRYDDAFNPTLVQRTFNTFKTQGPASRVTCACIDQRAAGGQYSGKRAFTCCRHHHPRRTR